MEDEEIVNLYWERQEKAIDETDKKYGKYCNTISFNILQNKEKNERTDNNNYRNGYYPERTVATETGDILVLCADGLTGLKETISAIYPKTEYQRCIVHQIRNYLRYVPYTDRKELANDLKTVYKASTEEIGYTNLIELEKNFLSPIKFTQLFLKG